MCATQCTRPHQPCHIYIYIYIRIYVKCHWVLSWSAIFNGTVIVQTLRKLSEGRKQKSFRFPTQAIRTIINAWVNRVSIRHYASFSDEIHTVYSSSVRSSTPKNVKTRGASLRVSCDNQIQIQLWGKGKEGFTFFEKLLENQVDCSRGGSK